MIEWHSRKVVHSTIKGVRRDKSHNGVEVGTVVALGWRYPTYIGHMDNI
jgi:hypothetical protein